MVVGCFGLTLCDAEFDLQVHRCRHHRLGEDQDVLQSYDNHQVGKDLPANRIHILVDLFILRGELVKKNH